jgi:hypothetical protein
MFSNHHFEARKSEYPNFPISFFKKLTHVVLCSSVEQIIKILKQNTLNCEFQFGRIFSAPVIFRLEKGVEQ